MSATLTFLSGSMKGRELKLSGSITVGRASGRDVRFSADEKQVSRNHATILLRDGGFELRDDGSSNGTLLNGQELDRGASRKLQPGDVITFGHGGPQARFADAARAKAKSTRPLPPGAARQAPISPPVAGGRARGGGSASGGTRGSTGGGELTRLFQDVVVNRPADQGRTVAMKDFVGIALRRSRQRTRVIVGATLAASIVMVIGAVLFMGIREAETRQRAAAQIDSLEQWANLSLGTLEERVRQLNEEAGAAQDEVGALQSAIGELRRQQGEELARVRRMVGFSEEIATRYAPGVGMITNSLIFVDDAGRPVRVRSEPDGSYTVSLEGSDAILAFASGGTGFLIHRDGWLLTNRHVVDAPYAASAGGGVADYAGQLEQALNTRVTPQSTDFAAYFPNQSRRIPLEVVATSSEMDVALVRVAGGSPGIEPLPLAPAETDVRRGENIVLMGYPAGHELLLNNLPEGDPLPGRVCYRDCSVGERDQAVAALAQRGLVQPMVSAGQINATPPNQIGFAVTGSSTGGSSGGPVLNAEGQVIAVNWGRGVFDDQGFRPQRAALVRFGVALLPPEVRATLSYR